MDREWVNESACVGTPTEMFFAPDLHAKAKAICVECPVITQCLNYALETGTEYGIFGGTTGSERLRMLRARRRINRENAI